MRLTAPLLLWLALAAPAAAQVCEASVFGKVGEVMATVDKAEGPVLVSWAVEQREGIGEETERFSRPGLMLDFTPGSPLEVTGAIVSVTQISRGGARQLPLSRVMVRANAGGPVLEWPADNAGAGEAKLAKQLKAAWPREVEIEVLLDGAVAASAMFDLSTLPAVEANAGEALAKAAGKCR